MIRVMNLNYVYGKGLPTSRQALFDINIEIDKGETVALIGHTGSGKSTLIQHFNALSIPDSGTVLIDGLNVFDKNVNKSEIRKRIGLVFQYPEYQLFEETVYEDIAFGPKNLGLSEEEVKRRVFDACEIMEIDHKYLTASPFDLSGGQKRRVAIAGIVAMEPSVLVLDEPVAGLDPKGRKRIFSMIKKLKTQRPHLTVVFVSHSMEDVAAVADRIIVMNGGRVAMTGSVSQIFSKAEELKKIGLSAPQITNIMAGLKKKGFAVPDDIYTLDKGIDVISGLFEKEADKLV